MFYSQSSILTICLKYDTENFIECLDEKLLTALNRVDESFLSISFYYEKI